VVLPAPVTPMPNTAVAFPPPPSPAQTARADATATTSNAGARTAGGGEPRRIRTLTIRPDGTDAEGKPVGGIEAAPSSPRRTVAAPSRGSPLALTPGSEAPARPAPAAQSATRLASAPSHGAAGGYMVQISSQRSEADAHASYRAMQAKYRGVLGGHEGVVRRADLGARGTYYRAMVGPFASASEAGQLCSQLKAAGGQCIIHRN
jgi:cell division septation protein DedD